MRSIVSRLLFTGAAVAAVAAFSYAGLHDVLSPPERASIVADAPAYARERAAIDVNRDAMRQLGALSLISPAAAQTYPTSQPVYVPTPTLSPVSIPAASAPTTVTFTTQGLGDVTFRLSGTYTGLAATIDGTNDLTSAGSPTWTTLQVQPVGGGASVKAIAGAVQGMWRVDAGGFTKLRVNVSAMSTGTLVVNAAGSGAINLNKLVSPVGPNSAAIATLTTQTTATVTTSDQDFGSRGAVCFFNQSAHSGSTSTVFTIDNKDVVSGNYVEVARSNAVTSADGTPLPLTVYPGLGAVSGVTVSAALASKWRARVIVGSTGNVTGTLACDPVL